MNNIKQIRASILLISTELLKLAALLGSEEEVQPVQAAPTTAPVQAPEPIQTSNLAEQLRRDYSTGGNWAKTAHKFGLRKAEAVRIAHTAPPTSALTPGLLPDRVYSILKASSTPLTFSQLASALANNGGMPSAGSMISAIHRLRCQGRLKSVARPRRGSKSGTYGHRVAYTLAA